MAADLERAIAAGDQFPTVSRLRGASGQIWWFEESEAKGRPPCEFADEEMNRILFEREELHDDGLLRLRGRRALHVRGVLKLEPGDAVRVGVINGPVGTAVVRECRDESVLLECTVDGPVPPVPPVDLILALPRPKVVRRLWAQLASLGVGRIFLTNASKVERNYFATHLLDPAGYTHLLIEGLEQSGDTRLPEVRICRRLKPFMEDELPALFDRHRRILLHPDADQGLGGLLFERGERVAIAVGPEGGWTDFELDLFAGHGFIRASLGPRTLRSDTACIAAIAMTHAKLGE